MDKPFTAVDPAHYRTGNFECIDVMLETQGKRATQDFCLLNAFKYIYRHDKKNGVEDIKKAQWYINKYLELEDKDMFEQNKNVKVTVGTIGKDGKTVHTLSDDEMETLLHHFFSNDQDEGSNDQDKDKDFSEMFESLDLIAELAAHAKKSFLEHGFSNDETFTLARELLSMGAKR